MGALTTIHMINNKHSAWLGVLVTVFMLLVSTSYADTSKGKVALIAARGSGIEAMSVRDIRRVYLGLKSATSVLVKNPVLNVQSKTLYDEFLKNTMRMTEGSYKRKLVKRMFRQGSVEILEVTSLEELNKHLQGNIGDISFIETTSLGSLDNIEIIQILW